MSELRHRLQALPLDRQVAMLSGADFWMTAGSSAAGVPAMLMSDGPHGLRRQVDDGDHAGIGNAVPATCFPTASNLASSWDVEMLERVGVALGREARAAGVGVLLGPGLNIKRHPAGGRNFEYLSEDPVLSGTLAAAMVRGVQSQGVGACLKHFVANNNESYRMVCDVVVDERTLREIYLRGFEIAVREADPWSVMTSYNLVNGEYVSESTRLLTDVLRGEWGFDGVVVTDWGGINDRVAASLAGLDLEMPSSGGAHDAAVLAAVRTEVLAPDVMTDRLEAIAKIALRCRDEVNDRGRGTVEEFEQHRVARRAAAAGTVLLTNNGVLPLDPACNIAIIGDFAQHPRFQGAGSSLVTPTRLDDARRELEYRVGGSVAYEAGYDVDTGEASAEQIRRATEIAGDAEVALVFVGLPPIAEAEGYDRDTLALPAGHDALVTAVCAANPNTVVVLSNGAPVLLPWADRPAAIVEGYLAGQAGASAIVDVLLGEAEPGGRLAESFPASMVFPAEENFAGRTRQIQYREGLYVGYRFHDSAGVAARFAFGHGLSYTTFVWSSPVITGSGSDLTVSVTVSNTGDRAGSDVVQLYVHDVESTVYRPDKELRAFAKVHLAAGESTTVDMKLDERAFAFYDVDDERWRVEAGQFELLIAASSIDVRNRVTVDVPGDVLAKSPTGAGGPGTRSFVATATEFEAMLGGPIPDPIPVLPFTLNTVVEELATTRLGRVAQRGILAMAEREKAKVLGDEPDPALAKVMERMIAEAPLRLLVSLSQGTASLGAFDGLTKLLSALRLTGRRS